jgi:hypothetical protein
VLRPLLVLQGVIKHLLQGVADLGRLDPYGDAKPPVGTGLSAVMQSVPMSGCPGNLYG